METDIERETLETDILIVGAGSAGLACAIHLHDAVAAHNAAHPEQALDKPSILVLEKGKQVGAHILSGCVLDPRALNELLPNWKSLDAPIKQIVTSEEIAWLSPSGKTRVPEMVVPPYLHNQGNYIVRLGDVANWLSQQAQSRGVEMLEGVGGARLLIAEGDGPPMPLPLPLSTLHSTPPPFTEKTRVVGVQCADTGLNKDGQPGENFLPGARIIAKAVVLAEGVRGSLAKPLLRAAKLEAYKEPQRFSTGVKEIWELPAGTFPAGHVLHSLGYPLQSLPGGLLPGQPFGGSFMYGIDETHVALGLVVGLDYRDPAQDPHHDFQRLKQHPYFKALLEKGKMVAYGAKAIPEGGYHALPKLYGNGFLLCGDTAGFLNAARLKGAHLAMKSGMLAADALLHAMLKKDFSAESLEKYSDLFEASWAAEELRGSADWRQGYEQGLALGSVHDFTARTFGVALVPKDNLPDWDSLKRSTPAPEKEDFPAPDGKLTFDKVTDVFHSGTLHGEKQPVHLLVADTNICVERCTKEFGNPCRHFCPAAVYDFVYAEKRLQINAGNCVHCKTCDIKDPYENITWAMPEGGDGPRYVGL